MHEAELPTLGRSCGQLRATREDDPDPEALRDEVHGQVIPTEAGHAVDVDRRGRVDRVVPIAGDEHRGQPDRRPA